MAAPTKNYPYQDQSLEDITGEQWEDIPGLDGYFLISNYGRIKRCQYEMQYRNGAIYIKPEKIIKPNIVRQPNHFKGDYTQFLAGRVTVNGIRHNFTVARMVYYCFAEQFDLDDHRIVILCRDGDNFNIQPSNLVMASLDQKQQRTIERERFRSPLLDLSESDRQRQRQGIIQKVSKQVSQYTLKGKKIKTYPSAAAAERVTGVFATSIGNVASEAKVSAGGFIWRWGNEPRVDVAAMRQEKRKTYVEKHGQRVTQYDLSGKKVAQYPSIRDAAEVSGAQETAINLVLRGIYKSAKGYFWQKGYGADQIDLSDYKWGRESTAVTQSKPVEQYSLDGKHIKTYPSVKVAAQAIGVQPSTLSSAVNGKQLTCGGFKWKFE